MSTVLVVTSSTMGEASVSNQLIDHALQRLRAADPDLKIVTRDLAAQPVPHLTADSTAAVRGAEPANDAQAEARALSDALVAELKAADTVIIGAPMYNFGIPSTLKAWFDHVLRAGVTFRYGENGPEGLLPGKKTVVIESRGGLYSEGPAMPMDSQEPHLRTMLGFMGITDVSFVRAEKLGYGPEARDAAIAAAQSAIGESFAARLAA